MGFALKLIGVVALSGAITTGALQSQNTNAPTTPNCSDPKYRQLDFWVGEWDVFNTADNVRYADSRIEGIMNGCAIQENYSAPRAPGGPYAGTSYSSYDRKDGKWHQMYVDTTGRTTWYTGSLVGTEMVFTARGVAPNLLKMIYRAQSDGSVRQIGSISKDEGATWQQMYDYTYRKK